MAEAAQQRRACPRCGTEVDFAGVLPHQPGVAACPNCGAEVAFAPDAGTADQRTALADQTHPEDTGRIEGAETTTCHNCGHDVPLRGATPAEMTGRDPAGVADTVTCPNCGVEVAATTDSSPKQPPDVEVDDAAR